MKKALDVVGGDKELLNELLEMFFKDCPEKIRNLEQAIKSKDYELLREVAHNLKGASGNLGLTNIYKLCLTLENKGKQKDLSDADKMLSELKEHISKLRRMMNGQ